MYVYFLVCYHVIATQCVRRVEYVFVHLYILVDESECPWTMNSLCYPLCSPFSCTSLSPQKSAPPPSPKKNKTVLSDTSPIVLAWVGHVCIYCMASHKTSGWGGVLSPKQVYAAHLIRGLIFFFQ